MKTLDSETIERIRRRATKIQFDRKMIGGTGDIRLDAEDLLSLIDEVLIARKQKDPE